MRRGDVVLVAEGKPRPAVIVQADRLPTPLEILICPLTTFLVDAPIYRPQVEPDETNGLKATSQLMADKITPARRERVGHVIGRLDEASLAKLNTSLLVILDLANA